MTKVLTTCCSEVQPCAMPRMLRLDFPWNPNCSRAGPRSTRCMHFLHAPDACTFCYCRRVEKQPELLVDETGHYDGRRQADDAHTVQLVRDSSLQDVHLVCRDSSTASGNDTISHLPSASVAATERNWKKKEEEKTEVQNGKHKFTLTVLHRAFSTQVRHGRLNSKPVSSATPLLLYNVDR